MTARSASPSSTHAVAGADAIVALLHDRVDDALLEAAGPQLQILANVAVGYDNIDVAAASRRGVLITNTPGVLTDATADLTIALILMVTRRLAEGERLIRSRASWHWNLFMMVGTGLQGKTLGIVGLGAIGQATARRARAFGMEVVYSQRTRADVETEAALDARQQTLDQLIATADVISLHCPLTDETHHLIDAPRLGQMKPSAYPRERRAWADCRRGGAGAGAARRRDRRRGVGRL